MSAEVEISTLNQTALFDLRGHEVSLQVLFELFNLRQRQQMNVVVKNEWLKVLVIGPRRYLIQSEIKNEMEIEKILKSVSANPNISSTNISDMYMGFGISGRQANEALAQATTLNLHKLPVGGVTGTEIFSLGGIIVRDGLQELLIYVDRSYGQYVHKRLIKCVDAVSIAN